MLLLIFVYLSTAEIIFPFSGDYFCQSTETCVTYLYPIMNTSPSQYGSRRVAVIHPYLHIPPSSEGRSSMQPLPTDSDDGWPIRAGYLHITLADVAYETQRAQLRDWLQLFSPSGQPQSEEEHFYVYIMNTAIQEKLSLLQ